MLSWLIRRAAQRERLETLVEALGTRVSQLERERHELSVEHVERMSQLDAMLRRMTARAQRQDAAARFPETRQDKPAAKDIPSVIDFRRQLRGGA